MVTIDGESLEIAIIIDFGAIPESGVLGPSAGVCIHSCPAGEGAIDSFQGLRVKVVVSIKIKRLFVQWFDPSTHSSLGNLMFVYFCVQAEEEELYQLTSIRVTLHSRRPETRPASLHSIHCSIQPQASPRPMMLMMILKNRMTTIVVAEKVFSSLETPASRFRLIGWCMIPSRFIRHRLTCRLLVVATYYV